MNTAEGQAQFQRFKAICVPILGNSKLTPATIPTISSLLSQLIQGLRELDPANLTPSFISYVFFPVSSVLQRNLSAEIPDQILEKVLISLGLLCESWWWTCELKIWEQIFMLCGAVIGGLETKGKKRARDDETKEAAVRCMLSLLHERSPQDAIARMLPPEQARSRTKELQELSRASRFVPIIGQAIDSVLGTASSTRLSLQQSSLELLALMLDTYSPEDLVPTVLPGVTSVMTKVCLGIGGKKGWANGGVVAAALKVLRIAIVKAVGDDICMEEGALPRFENLEDLANLEKMDVDEPPRRPPAAYATARTPSWLRATTSQLHMAINTLNPLVKHPTPSALYGLIDFSTDVIAATALTLPQTQPMLVSFLLSLSNSEYPKVSASAMNSLKELLSVQRRHADLLQMLMQMTSQNLMSLPRFLSSQAGAKIQHAAEMVIAVCHLATLPDETPAMSSISKAIGKLLGPGGGIEKWGWSLLSVLEFVEPPVTVTHTTADQLLLENGSQETTWVPFPELSLKLISSREARHALEAMLHALGQAGGDSCLFSIEWFAEVGRGGILPRNVAAMWCSCRLLEGLGRVSLLSEINLNDSSLRRSKRVEKRSRELARTIAELWDKSGLDELAPDAPPQPPRHEDLEINIQHQKGLVPLHETLQIIHPRVKDDRPVQQPVIHRGLCLQLLSITAGILQNRFNSLFIFTLYPILHSIVSPAPFLASTGLAALNYVTIATSYASPANLLLSNFDYALDSVSRRLTRRWLDIDATKVLVILVRLVGPDVVAKAGDVVEECFDRLDAFHGYGVIVDGLIEVLTEVLNVIEMDVKANPDLAPKREEDAPREGVVRMKNLDSLLEWLPKRKDAQSVEEDATNDGPAPRKAWVEEEKGDEETAQQEEDEAARKAVKQGVQEPPPTPSQALTKQIITRSLYFLTHESPVIRARILHLLSLAVPVLPESALLPSIHNAWPFILNRLGDVETFVVASAANLVDVLVSDVGGFMYRRIWDDVWPRFQTILKQLEAGDSGSALARRGRSAVGTESAYTHSHRLYRSLLKTMTAVMRGVHPHEPSFWESLVLFRRFMGQHVHEELQACARLFYVAAGRKNSDAVWLVLEGTVGDVGVSICFMRDDRWKIEVNARDVLGSLDAQS